MGKLIYVFDFASVVFVLTYILFLSVSVWQPTTADESRGSRHEGIQCFKISCFLL